MIMERQIGDVFKYRGVKLEVVECESCRECYFSQNCKKMEIILSLGISRRDCHFTISRERYKHCIKDYNANEIVGHCAPFMRDDSTAVNFKKVKESWKDRFVRKFIE